MSVPISAPVVDTTHRPALEMSPVEKAEQSQDGQAVADNAPESNQTEETLAEEQAPSTEPSEHGSPLKAATSPAPESDHSEETPEGDQTPSTEPTECENGSQVAIGIAPESEQTEQILEGDQTPSTEPDQCGICLEEVSALASERTDYTCPSNGCRGVFCRECFARLMEEYSRCPICRCRAPRYGFEDGAPDVDAAPSAHGNPGWQEALDATIRGPQEIREQVRNVLDHPDSSARRPLQPNTSPVAMLLGGFSDLGHLHRNSSTSEDSDSSLSPNQNDELARDPDDAFIIGNGTRTYYSRHFF